ncbi:hypothetical protein RFM41_24780 [Mesorhizobium sp. VK25A]|uniref:DUF1844 domain-containing protein n=1 Tax=Mesorhizobium vachelliae TaxID=3072309 RepID=A0ABU5ACV3_9HYPH|nr:MULTISPECIES: hypothetical protein [unclassified Mesorhizobium]MDX8534343.1 hypothetical protein [Mesorhizobium sp. VK25D]MDX8546985.1 hypothetical protein [Mesorhizobium sp. VK25A]
MSLHTLHPERVDETRMHAYSTFGPLLIHALAQKLAHRQGMRELDKLEQSLVRLVEETDVTAPHAEAMKEFAVELVVSTLRNVREHPDAKHDLEETDERRTEGRSEDQNTLEEQLQSGLEGSFPASDPPAVVSTAITGSTKNIVGTDEVLRRKKQPRRKQSETAG